MVNDMVAEVAKINPRNNQQNPLAKVTVRHDTDLGAKLQAYVSPCSWMRTGYPFQITVSMKNGGTAILADKTLQFNDASVEDIDRMLKSIRVQKCKCRGCKRPAFDPDTVVTNRAGYCEDCFLGKLNKQFAKKQEIEKAKFERMNAKYKAKGYTHRVDAWIHHDDGDDEPITIWMVNATDATIRQELARRRSRQIDDYRIVPL